MTFFETHAVVASILHDFVAYGRRNASEEQRQTTYAVLSDVEHIALGQAVDEIGVEKFGKILLALHIGEPVVVGGADVKERRFCKRNSHFVEYEKNDKFLHLAVERLIGTELILNVIHSFTRKKIAAVICDFARNLPYTAASSNITTKTTDFQAQKRNKCRNTSYGAFLRRDTQRKRKNMGQFAKLRFGIDIDLFFV